MGLGSSPSIIRLAAAAGVFWLAILFVLTLTDVLASRQFQSAHSQTMGLEQSLDRNR
jgi:cytochrome c oxidase subunit 4